MAILTTKQRKRLPKSVFGLPEQEKYPINDKPHARSALSYASKEYDAGRLSLAQEKKIDKKADRMLGITHDAAKKTKSIHQRHA